MGNYRLSLASYSLHGMIEAGELDVFGYFDLLKNRYHLEYADIWNAGCLKSLDKDYLLKVKAGMDERGLKLANLCVDGPYVWCDKKDEREAHKKEMYAYLKAAKILGAKTLRIDFGYDDAGIDDNHNEKSGLGMERMHSMTDEAFDYIVNTYREYCDIASNFGCKVGPENHWGWDWIPEYLIKVCEAVDHPNYGHLYHLHSFGENIEAGETYAIKHAMHVHVHAASVLYAKECIRKLEKAGYDGVYSIEHHSGEYETERAEWQIGSIRAIIAELKGEDAGKPVSNTTFMDDIYYGKPRFY